MEEVEEEVVVDAVLDQVKSNDNQYDSSALGNVILNRDLQTPALGIFSPQNCFKTYDVAQGPKILENFVLDTCDLYLENADLYMARTIGQSSVSLWFYTYLVEIHCILFPVCSLHGCYLQF